MTELLVSVRNAEEAGEALRGGAHIIDVKDPTAGALGAATTAVCNDVLRVVDGRVPVSMALGELGEPSVGPIPPAMRFAKLGLAAAAGRADWRRQWADRIAAMPSSTYPVAVVYADWTRCDAPSPRDVLRAATQLDCRAMLIDTHDKHQGDLFAHFADHDLQLLCDAARSSGLRVVLAGSLRASSLDRALRLQPDVIAVRGAVCRPNREGQLVASMVADLAGRIATSSRPARRAPRISRPTN